MSLVLFSRSDLGCAFVRVVPSSQPGLFDAWPIGRTFQAYLVDEEEKAILSLSYLWPRLFFRPLFTLSSDILNVKVKSLS